MMHSTPTSAPASSPGVLSTLLVHWTPGLGFGCEIGLCIMKGRDSGNPTPPSPDQISSRPQCAARLDRPARIEPRHTPFL